jgi:hypothetical protein
MDGYVQDSTCGVVHHDLNNGGSLFEQSEHKKSPHSEHQAIALIGEGSQNEQNFASDWFDVAILLI